MTKKHVERIVAGLLRPINPYATGILGLLTFSWGVWIVNPMWSVFQSAPVFSRALEFAPEWAWGSWATACGAIILFAVMTGKFKTLSFALGFAIWHWSTVAGMLWWGDWHNTGGLTYSFIALWTTYAWLNIKINYVRLGKHIEF